MKSRLKRAASRTEILEAISDAKSLELLSLIAKGQGSKTKDLIAQVKISRRKYYGKTSKFLNTDLIAQRRKMASQQVRISHLWGCDFTCQRN
jgi:hypothetical protein